MSVKYQIIQKEVGTTMLLHLTLGESYKLVCDTVGTFDHSIITCHELQYIYIYMCVCIYCTTVDS